MTTLKRKTPKGYVSVAVPTSLHREMRIYVAANPQVKSLGNLVAMLWHYRGRAEQSPR